MGGIYDGTDSIHNEIVNYNYNNFLWLNSFMPFFRVYNSNINTIAGMYFNVDSIEYYNMIKKFSYDKKSIEKYKNKNYKIFSIIDNNKIKIEDFFYALNIRENDIPENCLGETFKEPDEEDEFYDFFDKNEIYFPSAYGDKYIINTNFYNKAIACNMYFQIKTIKFANLKKGVKFVIFLNDSDEFIKSTVDRTRNLKKNKIIEIDSFNIDEFISKNENKILYSVDEEKVKFTEYNMSKFCDIHQSIIPLLVVEIKKDSLFEELKINQNFIAKYIVIKQIKSNDKPELDESELEDIYDTWNLKNTIPKMFFFGSIFNSS